MQFILFVALFISVYNTIPKLICQGNRFQYTSSYVLGRQSALTRTITSLQPILKVANCSYKDQVYRTYTIFDFQSKLIYLQSKQYSQFLGSNTLRITGGTVRITYTFQWQKEQLGKSISGKGTGSVTTDIVTFDKTMEQTQDHDLIWNLTSDLNISIQNSLKLSTVDPPCSKADYQTLNQMLNKLASNQTTVKDNLILGINNDYQRLLRQEVKKDYTKNLSKVLTYIYRGYRGTFIAKFDNLLVQFQLTTKGLSVLFSQTTQNDSHFQCGPKVPTEPQDESVFGGEQEFISTMFLKSTLRYVIENGFLDVILSQQSWQSRAFQFYMGDVHEVIKSTDSISSFQSIKGGCKAHNDKLFQFKMKTSTTYTLIVNFTCTLQFDNKFLVGFQMPTIYEISPKLTKDSIDFYITDITGNPTFDQSIDFKITNVELAKFIISETMAITLNNKVIGSGFVTGNRKFPNLQIKQDYLFLYDSSHKPGQSGDMINSIKQNQLNDM